MTSSTSNRSYNPPEFLLYALDLTNLLECGHKLFQSIGVSTKQCNNKKSTNAQLYMTTANAFANLLRANGISVSKKAVKALRQFCGETGYRPKDNPTIHQDRNADPERFFWEELKKAARLEWETILSEYQDKVSKLLFTEAYEDDRLPKPKFLLHKTKKSKSWEKTEVAIYTISELIKLSRAYQGFNTRPYPKGGVKHDAPRFGIIQMQQKGSKQNRTQLQFNLKASYFYKL